MEKWKTKSRFSTFPPPRILLSQMQRPRRAAGLSPAPALEPAALRAASKKPTKETSRSIQLRAHPALERNCYFRLIPHWNRFSISGSFLDWKMLYLCRFHALPFCVHDSFKGGESENSAMVMTAWFTRWRRTFCPPFGSGMSSGASSGVAAPPKSSRREGARCTPHTHER